MPSLVVKLINLMAPSLNEIIVFGFQYKSALKQPENYTKFMERTGTKLLEERNKFVFIIVLLTFL